MYVTKLLIEYLCYSLLNSFEVFRAGEQGRFWYAVLGGQLEVRYHASAENDKKVSLSTTPQLITVLQI